MAIQGNFGGNRPPITRPLVGAPNPTQLSDRRIASPQNRFAGPLPFTQTPVTGETPAVEPRYTSPGSSDPRFSNFQDQRAAMTRPAMEMGTDGVARPAVMPSTGRYDLPSPEAMQPAPDGSDRMIRKPDFTPRPDWRNVMDNARNKAEGIQNLRAQIPHPNPGTDADQGWTGAQQARIGGIANAIRNRRQALGY